MVTQLVACLGHAGPASSCRGTVAHSRSSLKCDAPEGDLPHHPSQSTHPTGYGSPYRPRKGSSTRTDPFAAIKGGVPERQSRPNDGLHRETPRPAQEPNTGREPSVRPERGNL